MSWAIVGTTAFNFIAPKILGSGGGSGGGDLSSLAPYLSGAATAQRIPGQTTAGSYTPPAGGYGTYNYIPTGAEQLDPAMISQILSSMTNNNSAAGTAAPLNLDALMAALSRNNAAATTGAGANGALFNQAMANPFTDAMTNASNNAGGMSNQNAGQQQDWGRGLAGTGNDVNAMYSNLLSRAGNNPFTNSMISGAQGIGNSMTSAGGALTGAASGAISGINNPFYGQQLAGAQGAGNMLQSAGQSAYGQGQTFAGTAQAGLPAIQDILNTAFDPQTALYNKSATQNQDQISSYLARSGLTNSGAGAGIASDATTNFNLGWQNNQLGRQTAGLGAYTNALTGAGNNLATGQGMQTAGASNVAAGAGLPANTLNQQTGSQFDLSNKGATALGATSGLQAQGNAMPYNAYDTTTGDYAKYLNAYSGALPNIGGALTGGSNLLNQSVQSEYNAGAIPYNATQGINTNNQNSLANYLTSAGNINSLSGQSNINNFLTNAASGSNLSNQNISQISDYLRLVMGGSANAANAATGAQAGTNTANANAAGAINPLISGGLSGLQGLISQLFSGGGGSAMNYTPNSPQLYTTQPSIGTQIFG